MIIELNSKPLELPENTTAAGLLLSRQINPDHAVAIINGVVIPPNSLQTTTLHHGDCVELLAFVGGG